MNIQPIRNVSDCVPLYIPHSLYLKPIAKFNISVVLPPTSQPGKTISNWDVMEKLREIIAPDQFSMLKVTKSAIDFLRFEAESEDRAKVKTILSRLDGSSINLKAYTDVIKVRANEEKNEYPTRHHWDTYFRDTVDMDEMKCGERPDTLHISNLPIQWFCPRHLQNDDGVKPSESIFKRIFEKFGSIRSVDIPICDPYRKDMKSHMTGMKSFTFDQELYFEGYVQFSEYVGFVKAMDEFRGMKLVRKEIDQNLSVSIKVDFDKSKHLSEMSIKRRKFVRDRLIAKERAKEETERRQIQLEAEKKEQEKRRQEEIEKMEMEKQRLREEQRKEKNLKKLRAKDQHEIDSKIRDEEKQLLIVQRRLESIRIIDSLFERIKTKKMMLDMEEVKSEKKKRITYGHTNKTTTSSAPTTVNPNDATRNKLLKRMKVTYEQDYERYRNRVQKVKAGSTILGVALNDRSKISPIKKSDGLTTHNNNDDDDDDDEQQHTSDKTKKKKKKKKLKSKKKKKRLNSIKDSSSSDSSSSSSSSSDSESSSNKSSSEQIHNNQPPMVPPNMIGGGGAGGGYPMMHPMATNPWMNMGMYSMPRAPYYDGMTYEQPMHNPSSYPVNMIRMPTMGIRRPVGYVPYRFRGGGGGRPFYRGRGRGYPPYSGNYNNNHQFGNSNEMNDINYERRSNEYISKSRSRSHSRRSRSRSRRTRSSYSRSRSRSRSRSYSRSRRSNRARSTSAKSSHNRSHHSRSRSNNSSIKSKTRNNEITDGPGGAGAGAGKPSSSSTNVHRSRSITSRHSSSRTRKYYRPSTASRSASRSRSKSSNRSTRSNRSRRLLPPSRTETDNNKTSQNNKDYKEYNNNNNKNIIAVKDLRHKLKASKENASLSSPPSPSTGTLSSEQRKKENNRRDVQKQPIRRNRSITPPPPPTKNRNTRKSYSRHSSKSDSSDSSNDDDDDDDKHKHKHDGRSMMKSRHPQQSKVNQRSSDRSHGSNSHPRSAAAAAAPSSSGSSSEKSDRSDRVRSTKVERHSKSSASHSKSATSNNRSADNRRRSRSSRSRSHSRSDSPPNRSRTPPSAHTPTN